MPVRELDAVAQALQHLAQALQAAEAERRALGQRVITLQEDERARLARELHDEFGQQITALHVDAAWLARRLQDDPPALAVVQSLIAHCRHIQLELRSVLARLRPLADGRSGGADEGGPRTLGALQDLLQSLVDGWSRVPAPAARVRLQVQGPAAAALPAAVALALYRITQEALTNLARHAGAHEAVVEVQLDETTVLWRVSDDGVGLVDPAAALLRGSGLAGIKERVWALGGELSIQPLQPGLRLSARLRLADGSEAPAQAG
jgi:two-component system sensor histidine kinase UhpB